VKPGVPVEVTWSDAVSHTEWATLADHRAQEPVPIKSVGYLSLKTSKVVQIVQSASQLGENDKVADSLTIPIGWVTRIRRLK
jgi:hypothetical protein